MFSFERHFAYFYYGNSWYNKLIMKDLLRPGIRGWPAVSFSNLRVSIPFFKTLSISEWLSNAAVALDLLLNLFLEFNISNIFMSKMNSLVSLVSVKSWIFEFLRKVFDADTEWLNVWQQRWLSLYGCAILCASRSFYYQYLFAKPCAKPYFEAIFSPLRR